MSGARHGELITSLDVATYTVPTDAPEADGTATWDATTVVVVHAHGGGRTGLGWTYADAAAADVVRRVLAPQVVGRDLMDVPGAGAAMARALRNPGLPGIGATAVSAVDIALWDLKARVLEVALSTLLGRVTDAAPVYGSGGFTTYDDVRLAEQVAGWVHGDGIGRAKIKIGESWGTRVDRDVHRTAVARDAAGPGAELYVDANGGYGAGQAVRVAEELAALGVTWFEEPVSSDDLAGLAHVRRAVRPDVAAGEYGWTLSDLAGLLRAEAVDCLQADVTRCGGITVWQRAAALAAAHGLQISAHCAPQLSAHVAVSVPNTRHLEWFHDHVRLERMLFDGVLTVVGGALAPDAGAVGHGMSLRTADALRYAR